MTLVSSGCTVDGGWGKERGVWRENSEIYVAVAVPELLGGLAGNCRQEQLTACRKSEGCQAIAGSSATRANATGVLTTRGANLPQGEGLGLMSIAGSPPSASVAPISTLRHKDTCSSALCLCWKFPSAARIRGSAHACIQHSKHPCGSNSLGRSIRPSGTTSAALARSCEQQTSSHALQASCS